MDAIDQIVFAVYFEGPSGARSYRDAIRIAANVIQTLLNRAYNYWTCWQSNCAHSWINGKSRTPWEDITAEQLTRLLLFILSESYPGGDGQDYPAYNAWSAPKIIPTTGGAKEVWGAIKAAVQDILAHPGADLLSVVKIPYEDKMWYPNGNLLNRDVMYYGYKEGGFDPRPPGVVWCDEVFRDEKDDQCYGIRPINP
jgi:hypothetical protein